MNLRFMKSGPACALVVSVLTGPLPAEAKEERRGASWVWCAGDCTYSGAHDTPGRALEAWNAYVDAGYQQCMASPAGGQCGSGCYTISQSGLSAPSWSPVIDGQPTYLSTVTQTATTYVPACEERPARTLVTNVDAGIAVQGAPRCPSSSWSLDNGQCVASIAELPRTCPLHTSGGSISTLFGNPVDPINGAKTEDQLDYAASDELLQVRRRYTSSGGGRWGWADLDARLLDETGRVPSSPAPGVRRSDVLIAPVLTYPPTHAPVGGTLQPGYQMREFPLQSKARGFADKVVLVKFPDGHKQRYVEGATGVFAGESGDRSVLSVTMPTGNNPVWTLRTERDGFLTFDSTGALTQRTLPSGAAASYVHSSAGVTVTSNVSGRSLAYIRASNEPHPTAVTLPGGQQITYQTDGLGQLRTVTREDQTTKTFLYDEPGLASVSNGVRRLLTGVVDENGKRKTTVNYEDGWAKSTEGANGINKYSFATYGNMVIATMPDGATTSVLRFEMGPDGERRLLSKDQPAGSGCSAATARTTYNSLGYVESTQSFIGTKTCFAYETSGRRLQTARVDGLTAAAACTVTAPKSVLPTSARKTSYLWHPDWRLEAKVAEPGKITTNVYNGQPDPFNGNAIASCAPATALLPDGKRIAVLCKRVEQSTSDANGATGFSAALQSTVPNRIWKWTYNDVGQVLSEDGPRTDVNDVTTYTYYTATTADYTKGDLQRITNAAGKSTEFTKYNKHGQVLESLDMNNVLTVNEYYPRQWLKGTTVGGQKTSYEYDAVGQLKKVTLPDGSFIGYDYDDAHRLVAVYDNLNNRTVYELDNAGNRKSESTKDPSGNLKRQLTRSIDALGRVQQTTGRE